MSSSSSDVELYSQFAEVYDETFKHVPYFSWADFIRQIFLNHGISENDIIADLACGTASLARYLKPIYRNLISLDRSRPMLVKAQEKKVSELVEADLTSLPFRKKSLHGAFSCHDSLNYLRDYSSLAAHLKQMYQVLAPQGIYIFDLSSEKNVIKNYHDQSFKNKFHKCTVHWQNFYDYESREITSILEFERKNRENKVEVHQQTIFEEKRVLALAKKAGLLLLQTAADYSLRKKIAKANLITYVMQRP